MIKIIKIEVIAYKQPQFLFVAFHFPELSVMRTRTWHGHSESLKSVTSLASQRRRLRPTDVSKLLLRSTTLWSTVETSTAAVGQPWMQPLLSPLDGSKPDKLQLSPKNKLKTKKKK